MAADDGSIAWAVAWFSTAAAANDREAARQALRLARQRIHDTTTLLSDLLGELRFAEGARIAMSRGLPMQGEYEDAITLAAEYLQATGVAASTGCLPQQQPLRDA
jgi:hypothetical protein